MKGQGSSGLWLLVIGLIALFMVATMVAPALIDQTKGVTSNGADDSDNGSQVLKFNSPIIVLEKSTLEQGGSTRLTIRATPETPTTEGGGSFAWIISIDGSKGQGGDFFVYYGEQMVQWFAGQNGAIVGIGPRFTQGPGAASVEISTSLSVVANAAGSFALNAWVAEAKDLVSLDPTILQARSPVQSQSFQVAEKVAIGATVVQTLSGPTSAKEDSYVKFTLTSQAHATGKWKSTITDFIAITKSGIRSSDVLARVTTDRASRSISWTDSGDRLVGTLASSSPFKGTENSESAQWTTSFELEFTTSANYKIECWSVESGTEKVMSSTISHDVEVKKTITTTPVINTTTPSTSNATVTPTAPVVNTPTPAASNMTPATPAPTNGSATNATNRT